MSKMNAKLKILASCFMLSLWVACTPAFAEEKNQSNQMQLIISCIKKDADNLDISRFPKSNEQVFLKLDQKKGIEIYRFPRKIRHIDAFWYIVYYDPHQMNLWIKRGGGFAGSTNFFGPMKITALGK
jgi:hypothetical protein